MRALSILKKVTFASVAAVLVSAISLASTSAIEYTPTHPGTTRPAFNVFTGVPQEGDESDFFRGKEETNPGDSVTNVQSACNDGTRFTLRVYVHNAANQTLNNNGTGPGVARGTKVRVALPNPPKNSNFSLSSVISADNATTVSDGMTINCGGKTVTLSYVAGSAKQFTAHTGTKALSDSIVTTGAPIGTINPDGNVWGCFGQRVWVTLTVVVKEEAAPPTPAFSCDLLTITADRDRRVRVTAFDTTANNGATFKNATVDWGDGSADHTATNIVGATHQYDKDGTFTITATARFTVDGREVTDSGPECQQKVTFKPGQPPEVVTTVTPTPTPPTPSPTVTPTPSKLVETGPGAVAGIVAATSVLGAAAHRRLLSRRLSD